MRAQNFAIILVGMAFFAHSADRDRYVTGSALGSGSGKATGGLTDYSLVGAWPGG